MSPYRLHLEELMRFKRYVYVHLHVWPALPKNAKASLILPDKTKIDIPVECRRDHSVLIREILVSSPNQPVHRSLLSVSCGSGRVVEFGEIGAATPPDMARALSNEFYEYSRSLRNVSVLELGSRTRDATTFVARDKVFFDPSIKYSGLDIIAGPNVDVVGDVHQLSKYFGKESFDLVYSNWVFEHLMMPWLAAIEINKVLRKGGELFINTNHSISLHDFPWDFWRYSETCWHGLLNEFTGFEILKTAIGDPVRITPMRYDDGFRDHEGGLGFQTSTVWARKISDSTGVWNADSDALHNRLSRAYPEQITD
jgi:SAM-dependent methyltransferase